MQHDRADDRRALSGDLSLKLPHIVVSAYNDVCTRVPVERVRPFILFVPRQQKSRFNLCRDLTWELSSRHERDKEAASKRLEISIPVLTPERPSMQQ